MRDSEDTVDRLGMFVGTWRGVGVTHPSPWSAGGAGEAAWRFRLGPGGRSLIGDFEEVREDASRFEGHGVLTIDPENGEWLWFWFDQIGFPPLAPARGRWEADALSLVKVTPRGRGVSTFRFDGKALIYSNHAQPAGQADTIPVSEARLLRA